MNPLSSKALARNFRMLYLRAAMAAAFAALSWGAGFAADAVSMTITSKNGDYQLNGSFRVEADPSVIWDVLTAYEQIPRFVGSLKKSHVEQDLGPYHFLLDQEFEGGFLFFTKRVRVLLDVHETWQQQIEFSDIDHKDFKLYQGGWDVKAAGDGAQEITYTLEARPNFDAPFMGDNMSGGTKDLLSCVLKEILRRQAILDAQRKKDPPAALAQTTGNLPSSNRP